MGAWGFRNFENDNAGDWVVELMSSPNWDFIEKTILEYRNNNYNDFEEEILAATEVVAIARNNPPPDYNEIDFNLEPVLKKLPKLSDNKLILLSIEAIEGIMKKSNLKERIEDVDALEEWNEILFDLIERIKK